MSALALRTERTGDHVAEVVLTGPGKGNAMGPAFWQECPRVFDELGMDPTVRAIIVRGQGGHFTYGLDLPAMGAELLPLVGGSPGAPERTRLLAMIGAMQGAFNAIARTPKPVIAAIAGWCIGGGVDLITACDIRLCASDAKFSVREVKVAMVADLGSLQRLPSIVGEGHARELALTGRDIDARRAERIGLVNEVFDDEAALLAGARALAAELAANSPLVVTGIKHVMNARTEREVDAGLHTVALWNAAFLPSEDLGEAFAAFAMRRMPRYAGR